MCASIDLLPISAFGQDQPVAVTFELWVTTWVNNDIPRLSGVCSFD
jgi:hypothetical protein